ncbi:MAG: hypothetical protein HY812_09640 [Planctomycetes bacterium]|nr:hypothetical protein [Planctomycetota bacterium]
MLVLSVLHSVFCLLVGFVLSGAPDSPGYGLVGAAVLALPFQLFAWRSPAWCQFGVVVLTFLLIRFWREATPEFDVGLESEEVATRFLDQLSAGHLDAAYALCAEGVSREELATLVEAKRLDQIQSFRLVRSDDVRRLTTWVEFTVIQKAASTTDQEPERLIGLWVVARRWKSPAVCSIAFDGQEEIPFSRQ